MNRTKNVCLFLVFLMAVSAPALWPEETAPFQVNRLSPRVLVLTEISPMENMIVALASRKGLVVVDTTGSPQTAGLARKVIAREFGRNDFAWVINTHFHWDHTFGNAAFEDVPVIIQENALPGIQQDEAGLTQYLAGLERAVADLSRQISEAPPQSAALQALELRRAFFVRNLEGMKGRDRLVRPTITFNDRLTLRLDDLTINLIFFGRAHSTSDILVHVPEEGLLLTGDLFLERGWLPLFSGQIELDIPRWIKVLNEVLAPESKVRWVVPGHRDIWSPEKLGLWRDYIVDLWGTVKEAKEQGLDAETILAGHPLGPQFDYLKGLGHEEAALRRFHERNVRSFRGQLFPSAAVDIGRVAREKGVEAAQARFRLLRSEKPATFRFEEREFNGLGYEFLGQQKIPEAIALFQMNVELFPGSANVYDSLGEALAAGGDLDQAITNYAKSLELNPNNTNAKEALKRLQEQKAKKDK
jgi:glyoxylase-like metal-dependent hydrolase (beta-lactamase superfamily II)